MIRKYQDDEILFEVAEVVEVESMDQWVQGLDRLQFSNHHFKTHHQRKICKCVMYGYPR